MPDTLTFEEAIAAPPDTLSFEEALESEQPAELRAPVLPPEATLPDILSQPSPVQPPWEGGVVRTAFPGMLQPEQLLPAVRKIGGEVVTGEQGDTHPDIIEQEQIPAIEIDQRGFTGPGGTFLDRESAATALQAPTEFEPGRLHSTDLAREQETPSVQPPTFEQPLQITDKGPVYQSAIEAQKFGTIARPEPTEWSEITGIPPETLARWRVSPPGRALFGGTETERALGIPEAAHPSIMEVTMPAWMGLGGGARIMSTTGKTINAAVTSGFLAEFARTVPDAYRSFRDAVVRRDWREARNIAVEFGFGTVFAALNVLGLHEQFRHWDRVAGQAQETFERTAREEVPPAEEGIPGKEPPTVKGTEESQRAEKARAARIIRIKEQGPTPEDMVLFSGQSLEAAGASPEAVEALAKELGIKWERPKPVQPVTAPEPVAATEVAKPTEPVKPTEPTKPVEAPKPTQALAEIPPDVSQTVSTFAQQMRGPDRVDNSHTIAAAKGVSSISDLNFLSTLLDEARTQTSQAHKAAQAAQGLPTYLELLNRAVLLSGRNQLPREVIEAATDTGSWEGLMKAHGGSTLDWRTHPEVAEWLKQNAGRLRIELPDELKATPAKAPTVAVSPPTTPVTPTTPVPTPTPPVPKPQPPVTPIPPVVAKPVETPAKQKSTFDTKEAKGQKKFLLDEIDKAIEEAPDIAIGEWRSEEVKADWLAAQDAYTGEPVRQQFETEEDYKAARIAWESRPGKISDLFQKYNIPTKTKGSVPYKNVLGETQQTYTEETIGFTGRMELLRQAISDANRALVPKIVIEVPGDGVFTVPNTKAALTNFRERAESFPTTTPKVAKISTPRGKPTSPSPLGELSSDATKKAAALVVSDDPRRYVLSHMWSDGTQTVATDGRRLILIKKGIGGTEKKPLLITPGGKKSDEKFPNWTQVIPEDASLKVLSKDADAARLFTIVRQAQEATSEKSNSVTIWKNPDGSLGISSHSPGITSYVHNVGPAATAVVSVNPVYFLDALNAARIVGDEKVTIKVASEDTELHPIVVESAGAKSIVMPMRMVDTGVMRPPTAPEPPAISTLPDHMATFDYGRVVAATKGATKGAYRALLEKAVSEGKPINRLGWRVTLGLEDPAGYVKSKDLLIKKELPKKVKPAPAPPPPVSEEPKPAPPTPPAEVPPPEETYQQRLERHIETLKYRIAQDKKRGMTDPEKIRQLASYEAQLKSLTGGPPPAAAPPTVPQQPPTPTAPPAPGQPIIDKSRADAIRERLKKKLSEAPEGEEMALESVEPEALEARVSKEDGGIFSDAVQIGSYYIQSGLHEFGPWSAQMRQDFGEAIEPYLRSVYATARATIESPSGEAGGNLRAPGLDPRLLPPDRRVVTAREPLTKQVDESVIPAELVPHLDAHQRQDSARAIIGIDSVGGHLNASGTGTGKTRVGLTVAHWAAKKGFKVIYITRAEAIKPDWKKGTFGGSLFNDSKTMGVAVKLSRTATISRGEIGITTYENTLSVMRQSDPYTVLIWDESHSLKNPSQRGRNGDRANARAKAVVFMSATPADKPQHIYYLTRMGIMEGNSVATQLRHLGMIEVEVPYIEKETGQRRTHKVWVPNQNITEADRNERFENLFNRMTEKGAMVKREISMQGVTVQILKVALPPKAHDLQQDILKFFDADTVDDLKGIKKAIALMHMRRQQEPFKIAPAVLLTQRELAAGRQVMLFVSRVNESEVGRWITDPMTGEKVRHVLMSSEGTAKALRAAFHEAGIHDIAEIHGGADQASLEALDDYNSGRKRVCIATIESGGTGINADDTVGNRPRSMVVVTAPFDAVSNVQAAGRGWRLKTMSPFQIFYLFADTDVDGWNAEIIGSKMRTLGAVVQGQVGRLDISNPDAVTTDDFHGGKAAPKPAAPAPGAPAPGAPEAKAFPVLDWKPFTTKKGTTVMRADATPEFWAWWRSSGGTKNPLGIRVSKYQGNWNVWSPTVPESKPTGAPPAASEPDVGPGGETALEMKSLDPVTGLPAGVPNGGPNFARELMAASHRLGTTVHSRTTLGPGILGHYVPARAGVRKADKIEVGDIQNQGTVAHEMGHDIDALLFLAVWAKGQPHIHSQQSLAERIGLPDKDKGKLVAELTPVSELMRGPITGSKAHVRYRRRATELIADWFSLYAHDPARARSMAPLWTRGFETALAADANAAQTVQQLHAGNVEPISPDPGAAATGAAPAGMPGKVSPRPEVITPRENAAALAAETLVKGTIRRFEAEVQRARVRAEKWRLQVPDSQDRNDVGAFVEGIGNLEIPGDTRQLVIGRMTPAKNTLAKEYRFHIELQRQKINQFLHGMTTGEYLKYLPEYLAHFYVNSRTPAGQQAIAKFIKNSPNAKQRKIPNLREAVEYGFIPISQDPSVIYEIHSRINWRVATNRAFLAALKKVRTSSGDPVIVPAGQNPGGWPVSDNPLIARVYAHQTPSGVMLWRGGAAVHPDVWHAVRQILDLPTRSDLARLYDAINSITRVNAFAFSLFHDITLRSASLGAQMEVTNPLRGLFKLFEKNPVTGELSILEGTRSIGKQLLSNEDIVADAALHGLKFAWTESETYQHVARDVLDRLAARWRTIPYLGRTVRVARNIQHYRQEGLWRNTHDALKIAAYHDLVGKALAEAPPGTNPTMVKERIASLLNDAFGGQEWQTKFWMSPQVRLNLSRFFLAPDWTLSTLRSVPFVSDAASVTRGQLARLTGRGPERTPKEGWRGNIGRGRFWMAEIAALAMATIAVQWLIYRLFGRDDRGDKPWIWDNETGQNARIDATPLMRNLPWRDPNDPTRYYVNLGKRPQEILHWFLSPERNIQSKMARPLIEVIRQITGMEGDFKAPWQRDHETFVESIPARAKSAALEFAPFVFSGNQFALSLPYRKGMSKYKAEQAFESAYEMIADPSRVRQVLRGEFSGNMERALNDIRDAALRNGVPVKETESRARSAVRGAHYSRYFRAYQKGDQKTMDRESDALERLGVTPGMISQSVRRHEKLEPVLSY